MHFQAEEAVWFSCHYQPRWTHKTYLYNTVWIL